MEYKKDFSIVIPFHNEEGSLKELLPSLLNMLRSINKSYEIIFIDDASTDNSSEIIKEYQNNNPEIILIQLEKQSGQTGCYKAAFEKASGEYIIRMDADLQDNPKDLPKFMEKIDAGSELIMGLRECRKHSRILRLASGLYDLFILALFNSPLHSNSGSYVGFKTTLVKNIPFRKNDHRYLPLIAIRRGAKNISEVFVSHSERKWGISKYNPYTKIILGIPEVFRFLFRYLSGVYD